MLLVIPVAFLETWVITNKIIFFHAEVESVAKHRMMESPRDASESVLANIAIACQSLNEGSQFQDKMPELYKSCDNILDTVADLKLPMTSV